jgi:hypothetical protein
VRAITRKTSRPARTTTIRHSENTFEFIVKVGDYNDTSFGHFRPDCAQKATINISI